MEYIYNARDYVNSIKSKTPCTDCNNIFPPMVMDFDHLPEYTKSANISSLVNENKSRDVIDKELRKCELVCANCHRIRTQNRGKPSRKKKRYANGSRHHLTETFVKNIPIPDVGQKSYYDDDLVGFNVRVSQGGTKTYSVVLSKERRRITIGKADVLPLKTAKQEARKILVQYYLDKRP